MTLGRDASLNFGGRVADADGFGVGVEGGDIDGILVRLAVAVVVDLVAELIGVGVHEGLGVVAVGGIRHVAIGCGAGLDGGVGRSEAIAVGVGIEGGRAGGVVFVGVPVTVVVDTVADLSGRRVDLGVGVVAVFAGGKAVGVGVREARGAITVVVGGIRAVRLRGIRMDVIPRVVTVAGGVGVASGSVARLDGISVDPEAIGVGVGVPGQGIRSAFVGGAIAVVVDPVADLCRVWIHARIRVVAVVRGGKAVVVIIGVGVAVAVAVATRGRVGVDVDGRARLFARGASTGEREEGQQEQELGVHGNLGRGRIEWQSMYRAGQEPTVPDVMNACHRRCQRG